MRIEDFIDALTLREVVDAQQADRLRAKIEESQGRATPEAILSYLVKKGVITGQQAEDLEVSLLSVLGGGEPEVLDLMPLPEDQSAARDEPGWALEEEAAELIRPAPAPHLGAAPPPPPRRSTADDEFLAAAAGEGTSAESLGGGSRGPTAGGVYRLGAGKAKKKAKRTAGGKSQWDSPLLLVGGGVLAVLVLSGATLYYLLFRETADAILKDAERLVSAGAYSQAITRYEDFVKRFSSHSDASWARVELEMTRAWQAVDSMGDPADALAVVTQTIERIESQPAFIATAAEGRVSEAKRDLSTLLVRIAEALVERAERTDDQQEVERRVKQIEDVLALSSNDKYVPENLRNVPKLTSIRDSLAVIATRRQRDGDLSDAITAMDAAITAGRPSDAYAARLELLARHPALVEDPRLVEKLREASAAEQRSVVFQALGVAAETQWPQRAVVAELALADRTVVGDGPPGPPVVVRIDGALFGLSSGNGSLLWRRGAGQGDVAPVVALPGNHLAVSDLQQGEVWRLDAATGKLVWRQALDDRVIGLTLAGPRLLAASEGGKLYVIDAEEGRLAGVVAFTQPLRTAAAASERGDRIYVVGEHSVIYTLAAEDLSCAGVWYTGHAPGEITAPPVALLNKVLIAENAGNDSSRVRILKTDAQGVVAGEATSDRLLGRIVTPLAVSGRRVAVATTLGQLAAYEVSGAEGRGSLTPLARREGSARQPLAPHLLLHDGHLWIAAQSLAKLAILPTENQFSLVSLERDFPRDVFDATPQAIDDLVIHVRRSQGATGAVVAATNAKTNRALWETAVAVPLAGAPAAAGPLDLSLIAANGAAYRLDRQAMVRGVQDRAERPTGIPIKTPLTHAVELGEGRLAAGADGAATLVLSGPGGVRSIELSDPLAGPLAAWNGQLVAATAAGQVFSLNPDSGEPVATPFQPELAPNQRYRWLAPAAVETPAGPGLAVSDGEANIYLLKIVPEPTPHLALATSADVGADPLDSRLAVAGNTVLAATLGGRLARYAIPDLAAGDSIELGARAKWGPFAYGDSVLLATEAEELLWVGSNGTVHWRRALDRGAPRSQPLFDGDSVLAIVDGGVMRVSLKDGSETGFAEVGQPVAAGPVRLGERLVVTTPDGALLVVNRP